MNILFGEVTGEYLDNCIATGSNMFEKDGKYFDFNLEMDVDTFTLSDTMGRILPIGVGEFEELYQAVKIAKNYAKALVRYQNVSDLVSDDETLVLCD